MAQATAPLLDSTQSSRRRVERNAQDASQPFGAFFSRGAVRPVGETGGFSDDENASEGCTGPFYERRFLRRLAARARVAAEHG
jgi:hypothetical protein